MREIIPFEQVSSASVDATPELPLSVRQIYGREMVDARSKANIGAFDMYLGVKGVVGGAILEVLQSDYERTIEDSTSPESKHFMTYIATLAVDWKAVALAGAVFAAASGARRASRPHTVGADIEKTMKRAERVDVDEVIPHTLSTFDRYRRVRKAKEVVGTTVATLGAYKLGENLSLETNLMLGIAAGSVGYARLAASKMAHARRGF